MKTTCLFSAAILLSIATFAQTTVKKQQTANTVSAIRTEKGSSEVNSSGSASSSTSIRSNAVNNTENKAHATAEKGKNEIAAKKQEVITKAKTEEQQVKEATSKDVTVSANAQSNTGITAAEKDNKTEGNASLSNGTTVSSTAITNNSNQMNGELIGTTTAGTDLTVNKVNKVKTGSTEAVIKTCEKVHVGTATTVKAGSSVIHTVKPNPAALKVNSQVKANGGIRIK